MIHAAQQILRRRKSRSVPKKEPLFLAAVSMLVIMAARSRYRSCGSDELKHRLNAITGLENCWSLLAVVAWLLPESRQVGRPVSSLIRQIPFYLHILDQLRRYG